VAGESNAQLRCEFSVYACKIEETANGSRRGTRGEARQALEIVTQRRIAQNGELDESKRAAQNGEDEAQEVAEEKATLVSLEAVSS
jgi:hypothetical protein